MADNTTIAQSLINDALQAIEHHKASRIPAVTDAIGIAGYNLGQDVFFLLEDIRRYTRCLIQRIGVETPETYRRYIASAHTQLDEIVDAYGR